MLLLDKSYLKLAKACPADLGGLRCPSAAMVPHSQRCHIWQLANKLGDRCVHRCWEWGTMAAAVGHLGHNVLMDIVELLWVVSYVGICRVTYHVIGNAYLTRWQWASPPALEPSAWQPLCWIGRYAALSEKGHCGGKMEEEREETIPTTHTINIDQQWRSPPSYGRHGAPLPAFKHTTISKHTMVEFYIVKTRKTIKNNVYSF